jgi:DNA (cytosine-5)-methyltransferase 1
MEKDFSTLRQDAGLSIKECAEILEVSVSTAYRYESGDSKPRVLELQALKGLPKRKNPTAKNTQRSDG